MEKYVGYVLDMRTKEVVVATKVYNNHNSAAIAADRERCGLYMQDESLRLGVSVELENDEFEWS